MPANDPKNVTLQERDIALLVDLIESRVLTLDNICTLFFSDKNEMAKKRVQRLKAAGFLADRPRQIGQPSILHLTWKGYTALRDKGHLSDDSRMTPKQFKRRMAVSGTTLTHELMIGAVRTSFTLAMRLSKRFELVDFDVWPRRYDFKVNRGHATVPVKPDGHVRFLERRNGEEFEYDFFLEADTGSETIERVVEKCVNYREYHRSGGYNLYQYLISNPIRGSDPEGTVGFSTGLFPDNLSFAQYICLYECFGVMIPIASALCVCWCNNKTDTENMRTALDNPPPNTCCEDAASTIFPGVYAFCHGAAIASVAVALHCHCTCFTLW